MADISIRSDMLPLVAFPEEDMVLENQKVMQLFKEKNVVQVKDYLLSVNRDLSEVNDEFNEQLREHYSDILNVTRKIGSLHDELSNIDLEFRDLCFNDDSYQIHKLPNFKVTTGVSAPEETEEVDEDAEASHLVLVVSNWTLAVTNFIARFQNSNTSSRNLLSDMLKQMDQLSQLSRVKLTRYQEIIDSKVLTLQRHIVNSLTNNAIQLDLLELVETFNLFQTTQSTYRWDNVLIKQYNELLYDTILQNYNIESLYDKKESNIDNGTVMTFLQSQIFKENLVLKLESTIESTFENLRDSDNSDTTVCKELSKEELENDDEDEDDDDEHENDEYNISQIIQESQMKAKGLITDTNIHTHENVEKITNMLKNLQKIGCDSANIKQLRDKLVTFLQQKLSEDSKVLTKEDESTDSNEIVQSIMTQYSKSNHVKLIEEQIIVLNSLV